MKRLLCIVIITILLLPLKAFGAGKSLNKTSEPIIFDEIEEEILEKNPQVKINSNTIDSLNTSYSELWSQRSDVEDAIDSLDSGISYYAGKLTSLTSSLKPGETITDPDILSYISSNTSAMKDIYQAYLNVLSYNRSSLEEQLKNMGHQQEDIGRVIEKMKIQIAMINYQIVYTAENLYIAYDNVIHQQDEFRNNLSLLENQLKNIQVLKDLGLTGILDVKTIEIKLKETKLADKILAVQKKDIIGELNLMLGQDFDTDMIVSPLPMPDKNNIDSIAFDRDVLDALAASYVVRIQDEECKAKELIMNRAKEHEGEGSNSYRKAQKDLDSEKIRLNDEKRKFELAFYKCYEEVKDKQESLEIEKYRLESEKEKAGQLNKKFELGLISSLEINAGIVSYKSQELKVRTGENDLLKAYRKYIWMKKGVSLQSSGI